MNETSTLDRKVGFVENQEPREACLLLVDTSGSMAGAPIEALNKGLKAFEEFSKTNDLASKRVEIAIVSFNSEVAVELDFITADGFIAPSLQANGETSMGAGIKKAIEMTQAFKALCKSSGIDSFKPVIFMITDGAPTDDVAEAIQRIKEGEAANKFAFLAVGVEGANIKRLAEISVRSPIKLNGLDFDKMFECLWKSLEEGSTAKPNEQRAMQTGGWGSF